MGTLGGALLGGEGWYGLGRVGEIEHDEVERSRQGRVVQACEIRHLEVVVFVVDGYVADHAVQHGQRELPATFGAGGVARGVREQWRRERRQSGARGPVAHGAVGLEAAETR